jgi:hypothetical protein
MKEEFYQFIKGFGPNLSVERSELEKATKKFSEKKDEHEKYLSKCREIATKLESDSELMEHIIDGDQWFKKVGGDPSIYSNLLEILGNLMEKSAPLSHEAAAKMDNILSFLGKHVDINGSFPYFARAGLLTVVKRVFDGAVELASVDEKAAEFALDHLYKWPMKLHAWDYRSLGDYGNYKDDYFRLVGILKEVVESNKVRGWKSLMEKTSEMLKESGNVHTYFEKVQEEYDVYGKYLDGPLDWSHYEPSHLQNLLSSVKNDSEYWHGNMLKIKCYQRLDESFYNNVEELIKFREEYGKSDSKSQGVLAPTPEEKELINLINLVANLHHDIRSYRGHWDKNGGEAEKIYAQIMKFSGMLKLYSGRLS